MYFQIINFILILLVIIYISILSILYFHQPPVLTFEYKFSKLCTNYAVQKNCSGNNSSKSNGPVKWLNHKEEMGGLTIIGNSYEDCSFEVYNIGISNLLKKSTIGSFSWISYYNNKSQRKDKTDGLILKSNILSAGGIFKKYAGGTVIVDYRNDERVVKLYPYKK